MNKLLEPTFRTFSSLFPSPEHKICKNLAQSGKNFQKDLVINLLFLFIELIYLSDFFVQYMQIQKQKKNEQKVSGLQSSTPLNLNLYVSIEIFVSGILNFPHGSICKINTDRQVNYYVVAPNLSTLMSQR